ncbi:MAG: NADH-quinone oxidoreductase subunit L [Candidatus Omnitrophica bacterium]|jgi:multicomponent Na+:H+ antiporter subunit D|nr:NADH-quinone oxidoreductase subunit L [Candidatus Omnitrophota bacterium]
MVVLFILVPFILLLILNLPFKFLNARIAFWLSAALLLTQALLILINSLFAWSNYPAVLGQFLIFKLWLDPLAFIMLFTIAIVVFVSLLVARSTITTERRSFNFINLLLVALTGMNATVLVADIFSLYVFVEVTAVAVFVLMAIEKNRFAIEGTFKYLVLSMFASVFILTSIAFFILACGEVSFAGIHNAFLTNSNIILLNFAIGLFLCGLFIKCGVVPFHGWVPDAYSEAQSAVSVLLAGIVTKVTGIYVLMRLFSSVFVLKGSFHNLIMLIGVISIVFAALAAFRQDNIKRMLSYSSISQVGYIVLAIGCGTPLAILGAILHFFNHAIFKSLLFVNAAALEKKFGSTDVSIITGLGNQLPVTSATSLVGLLSTAGIPPLSGFWSKLIIIIALFNAQQFTYAWIALLASVLTLAYFLFMERNVFFIKTEAAPEGNDGVPFGIKFCEILLAAITIGVGLGFPFILNSQILQLRGLLY